MPDVNMWGKGLAVGQNFFYKVAMSELLANHYTDPETSVSQGPHSMDVTVTKKKGRKKLADNSYIEGLYCDFMFSVTLG